MPAFRVLGVPVRVHAATLPVHLVLAWSFSSDGDDALRRLAFVGVTLLSVLAHELGHALVARRQGLAVGDVRVHALGGLARIERRLPPEWRPSLEVWNALAGPATNLALAALAFGVTVAVGRALPVDTPRAAWADPVAAFVATNLVLGAVNLVPAFPSDGGRVLRALLATRLSYLRSTQVALAVSVVVVGGLLALALDRGWGTLLGWLPLVVMLGFYAVHEWRGSKAFDALETFRAFVTSHRARFPALDRLPKDPRGQPLPGPIDDPDLTAAWHAFLSARG